MGTAELTLPGFRHDLFSAFYPLALASPALRSLDLTAHGLRWCRAPVAVAHPTADGRCAYVADDPEETAASIDSYHPGDGDGWRRLYGLWERVHQPLVGALMSSFPPLRPGLRLAARLGPAELLRFSRFATLPVRRLGEEEFSGAGGPLLLAGTFDRDGELPVNPDGGLKSFGHPVGASGLRMFFECWLQLRGEAPEERRLATAAERTLALTHNLGGYPGEMVSFVGVVGSQPG